MSSSTSPQPTPHEVWERPFVTAHEKWCGDLVLELRLRDVPGRVIGDRLAEVEGHCTETGQTPSEAFGDPTDYAARLDHDSSPERASGVWTVTAAASTQVLAMLVGTSAVTAWARGESLAYDLGQVLCLGWSCSSCSACRCCCAPSFGTPEPWAAPCSPWSCSEPSAQPCPAAPTCPPAPRSPRPSSR